MRAIVPSFNRALQLDGLLRSLALHAEDTVEVRAICRADARHAESYEALRRKHDGVQFIRERDFRTDFLCALEWATSIDEPVLFLVDDTIFVRAWSPQCIVDGMRVDPNPIGHSLRLGRNTTNCYPLWRKQVMPFMIDGWRGDRIVAWEWPGADGDFGYPLEISSSALRREVALKIARLNFTNPNTLEAAFAESAPMFSRTHPWLTAYERSVAFSNPCNRVQTTFANRAGDTAEATADSLLERWEAGYRMHVEAYAGFEPDGAHCEAPIHLEPRP